MKVYCFYLVTFIFVFIIGCKKKDEIPPVLTLNGQDSLTVVLNSEYNDPGATATDDTDGNITSGIYIDNKVEEDKVGEYTVTYKVVDEAGNEATPLTRWVFVYNQGYYFTGNYNVNETQVFPGNDSCEYSIFIVADSAINFGLQFSSLACDFNRTVFTQIIDTMMLIPYQIFADSAGSVSLQGSGLTSDTMIQLNYTRTEGNIIELWNAIIKRQK